MLPSPTLAPTPRTVLYSEGCARLYRFLPSTSRVGPPILLIPSLINRWYVIDLRPGASLVEALVEAGIDVYCLDWGAPGDEDRYLTWDHVLRRLVRAARRVRKLTGRDRIDMLGYCMGGTLATIACALQPTWFSGLINLLGPIDFSKSGRLGEMVDPSIFDVDSVADAGNVMGTQMQAGFVALRPTLNMAKWVGVIDRALRGESLDGFVALERWASDNIAFPAAAYRTYIRELYQENRLVNGTHVALGRRVDLADIDCPTMAIVAEKDEICPPPAATAVPGCEVISVPGGHVGAVVGSRARHILYPRLAEFITRNDSEKVLQ